GRSARRRRGGDQRRQGRANVSQAVGEGQRAGRAGQARAGRERRRPDRPQALPGDGDGDQAALSFQEPPTPARSMVGSAKMMVKKGAAVVMLLVAACDPSLNMSGPPKARRTIDGCAEAVEHLHKCCPKFDSYLSCTVLESWAGQESSDLSAGESRCLL